VLGSNAVRRVAPILLVALALPLLAPALARADHLPGPCDLSGEFLGLFQHSAEAWPDRYEEWTRPSWQLSENALNGRRNAVVTIRMVNANGWGPWEGVGCDGEDRLTQALR
jgi:hypothetical protein